MSWLFCRQTGWIYTCVCVYLYGYVSELMDSSDYRLKQGPWQKLLLPPPQPPPLNPPPPFLFSSPNSYWRLWQVMIDGLIKSLIQNHSHSAHRSIMVLLPYHLQNNSNFAASLDKWKCISSSWGNIVTLSPKKNLFLVPSFKKNVEWKGRDKTIGRGFSVSILLKNYIGEKMQWVSRVCQLTTEGC